MRVLVVDDDPSVRGAVGAGLAPIEVVEACTGRSGLELLREQSFDVVLLDISMADLDGFEVLEMIRTDESFGRPAVLMLTGRVGESDRVNAYQLGADGYVTKPFDPDDLTKAVEEAAELTSEQRRARRNEELGMAELLDNLERGFGQ